MRRRRLRARARRECRCCHARGTRKAGQTRGAALVIDCSKYLDRVIAAMSRVGGRGRAGGGARPAESGVAQGPLFLSRSTRRPRPDATIGGMTANNSCGSRRCVWQHVHTSAASRRSSRTARQRGSERSRQPQEAQAGTLSRTWFSACGPCIGARPRRSSSASEGVAAVGGYNIDSIDGDGSHGGHTWRACWSAPRGTLAFFNRDRARLQRSRRTGCSGSAFPSFYSAMAATRQIVDLGPSAVELFDRTMIELSRDIPNVPRRRRPLRPGRAAAILLTNLPATTRRKSCGG